MTAPDAARAPGRDSTRARLGGPRAGARLAGAAELARLVGGLAVVLAVAAALLALADGVPSLLTGVPSGVRRARTVDEAERALRARVLLPAYFPATLAWPPRAIRYHPGRPGAVALFLDGRAGGPRVLLAQTMRPGPLPARLLPEAAVLSTSPVAIGPARGALSRVVEEGEVLWEVRWEQAGRQLVLRSRTGVEEALRMARSTREAQ